MDDQSAATAGATAWDVAAVLDLAAAEVREAGDPTPSWEDALERVRAARARCRRRTIRIIRRGESERKVIAAPYI